MSRELDALVEILDYPGTTVVLALSAANGYDLVSVAGGDRTWRRSLVVADDVEGEVEQQSVLEAARLEVVTLITGASHAQVETRRVNLVNAVEQRLFRVRLTVEGVVTTWATTGRADQVYPMDRHYLYARRRVANLSIPIAPRPL
jgi:hypothetical protein